MKTPHIHSYLFTYIHSLQQRGNTYLICINILLFDINKTPFHFSLHKYAVISITSSVCNLFWSAKFIIVASFPLNNNYDHRLDFVSNQMSCKNSKKQKSA